MKKRILFLISLCLTGSLFGQFADDFNRGETVNWIPKTAARWSVGLEYGRHAFFINTGEYYNEAPNKLGEYALVKDRTWSDFSFSCLARSRENFSTNSAADFAIVFGYQDNSNYYYMMFNRWNGNSQLFKIVSDARVEIATADFWIPDNEYHIVEIRRSGGMIAVKYDGRLVITACDATFGTGRIGVGSYNDAASFDDVQIEDAPLSYDRAIRMTSLVSPFVIADPAGNKSKPVIDVTPDGSFVLAWQQVTGKEFWSTWQEIYAIYAQPFSLSGNPLILAIPANTGFYGISPAIAARDDRFVVSWTDFPFGFPFLDNSRGITAKVIPLDGTQTGTTPIAWSPDGTWDIITDQSTSDVAYPGTDNFIAAWSQRVFMGYNSEVYFNKVPQNGGKVDNGINPHIAADSEGRFLVTWSNGTQAFSNAGTPVGVIFHSADAVSANASGSALISWTANGTVYVQRSTTSGTLGGGEILISENAGNSDVSVNRNGEACAVWETEMTGASDIRARFMQDDGTWTTSFFSINDDGGSWHSPRAALWEDCLYSVYENSEDTSIVAAVHLLENRPQNYSPSLVGATSDTAIEDVPYEYTPQATDPNGDNVSFSFLDFPTWLTPVEDAIAGTSRQGDGDTSFVVVASDGVSSDSFEIQIRMIPVNDPPQITSPDSVTAYTDSIFIYTPIIIDEEDSALTWTFLGYPSWLELPETFVPGNPPFISGIVPHDAQDTSFTVIASDGELEDTLCVHIHIESINVPPRIVNLSDFEFLNSESYAIPLDLCVTDNDSAELMTWTVVPENDSLGVILLENRIALFSSRDWAGTTPVLFCVTDPEGVSDSLTVVVTVWRDSDVPHTEEIYPNEYSLRPAFPNPFNANTVISYDLPVTAECTLAVYNLKGELLRELFRGRKEAGSFTLVWDGNGVPSGTYLIRMKANGFVQTRKCTLVK